MSADNQPTSASPVPTSLPSAVNQAESLSLKDFPPDWQYESTVSEVETIIAKIEAGELELADIFEQFGTAIKLLQTCEAFLKHHRQQVDILVETLIDEGHE